MKIYLIANNTTLSNKWINKINNKFKLNEDDKIIRFNTCDQLKIFNGKTTDVIFRCDNNIFQGIDKYFNIKNKYINSIKNKINLSVILWVDESSNKVNKKISQLKTIQKNNNINIKNIIPLSKKDINYTGKSPSTGFASMLYYLRKYPESEIILLGFTFHNGVQNWHNFAGEIQFAKKIMSKTNRLKIYNNYNI